MAAPVLQFKRGAFANLPALRAGEPGFTTDKYDLYVGLTSETSTNKFFGSHRYWGREDGTNSLQLKLVDKDGSNSINLKSPDTLSGIGTYILPDTDTIVDGYFLRVSTDGTLSWSNDIDSSGATLTNTTLTGITTIQGTQLNVTAPSNFTAIATFSNVDINDGTLDGVVIGQASPDAGYFTLVDTDRLISDFSTVGVATATDFHIDATRVLYDDGSGITLAGIQTIDATTKTTLETILAFDPNNFNNLNVVGVATVSGAVEANNFISTSTTLQAPTIGNFAGERLRLYDFDSPTNTNYAVGVETNHIWFGVDNNADNQGFKWYGEETQVMRLGGTGNLTIAGNFSATSGVATVGELRLTGTSGVGITAISTSTSLVENSDSYLPTQKAVKAYVDAVDVTLGINANTGGPSTVNTSQTLTISGTSNEIETSVSGQTITVGLPDAVIVGTSLSSPTIKTATVQHSNGTQAASIDASGNIVASQNFTVTGDLFVNGTTTQVNTGTLTVEDRTIELGIVGGAVTTSATTWDLGVLFNYYTDSAKKSAIVWEHSTGRFQLGSVVTDGGGTGNDNPQLTVSTFAPIEVAELWVNNTCTGGTQQVIGCVGAELQLQNITLDCGTF